MTEPAPPDLRQRRRAALADEIERVAIDLFVTKGIGEVTVEEIASAAGISARTFFRYFPTKADLVRAHRRRLDYRLIRALAARPEAESPVTALRAAFLATARMRPQDRDRYVEIGRMVSAGREAGVADVGFEMGTQLVDLVARRAGVDPAVEAWPGLLVAVMTAASQAAFRVWLDTDGHSDLETTLAGAFDALEGGLEDLQRWRPAGRRSPRQEGRTA